MESFRPPQPPHAKIGAAVQARWKGQEQMYPGVISAMHGDDTYDITFDDGDFEEQCVSLLRCVVLWCVVVWCGMCSWS